MLLYSANYLMAQMMMKVAKELNQEMRDIYFSYYSIMNGIVTPPERWQTCTAAASGERERTNDKSFCANCKSTLKLKLTSSGNAVIHSQNGYEVKKSLTLMSLLQRQLE